MTIEILPFNNTGKLSHHFRALILLESCYRVAKPNAFGTFGEARDKVNTMTCGKMKNDSVIGQMARSFRLVIVLVAGVFKSVGFRYA